MINYTTKLITLLWLLGVMVSCGGSSSDPDVTGPTVELTTPVDGQEFKRGTEIPLDAVFKDASGLSKCDITIVFNGESQKAPILKGTGTAWNPAENNEIHTITFNKEKSKFVQEAKLFNENIEGACKAGSYIVTFTMLDIGDNESKQTVDVTIL